MNARLLFVVALVVGVLLVGGIWKVGSQQSELERQSDQNANALAALCAFKDDLERRVKATEEFLREHPGGIPGVPIATLLESLANQKLTIKTLAPHLTDCKESVHDQRD